MLRKTQSLYKQTQQVIVLTVVSCCVFLTAPSVRADSPLTSTDFATAYQDVDIVKYASEKGIDEQVFKALSNPDIPYDVRAAIVNALGWSLPLNQENAKSHNAKAYLKYIAASHNKPPSALEIAELTPEEVFSLGYLLAMDNYWNRTLVAIGGMGQVEQADALTLLDAASNKLPDNFSVALIRSLVVAQKEYLFDPCGIYKTVSGMVKDFPGKQNMRSQAVEIVMKYITPFQESCPPT
jgi:hypothetical protein